MNKSFPYSQSQVIAESETRIEDSMASSLLKYVSSILGFCSRRKPITSNDSLVREEATLSNLLPNVIIEDILSRLRVKPLLRFRCVSKAWNSLIRDSDFIKMHLHRSNQNSTSILLIVHHLVDDDDDDEESDEAVKVRYPPRDAPPSELHLLDYEASDELVEVKYPPRAAKSCGKDGNLSTCDGLICVGGRLGKGIWILNPSTRKHKKLPKPLIRGDHYTLCNVELGLCYNTVTKDHEVVRIVCFSDYTRYSEVEVYSFSKNSWKRLQNIPYKIFPEDELNVSPALYDGALHWIGKHCRDEKTSGIGKTVIVSFDIGRRKFREVQLPEVYNVLWMEISVVYGKLCTLCNYEVGSELLVMEECGVKASWVHLRGPTCHLGVTVQGEFIKQDSDQNLCLYDLKPQNSEFSRVIKRGVPHLYNKGLPFVESLIQL